MDVSSPQTKQRVQSLASRISEDPAVGRIADYYTTGSRDFVSADGRSTYLAVDLKPTDDKEQQDAAKRIADRLDGDLGSRSAGPALAQEQVNKQVESDLRKAELLAFPFLFLLSLLFFRSGVAALLPPLIGGLAIVGTFLMLRVASELTSVSIFALNLVTGLGLGLAIDYSLFMVSRYREEIARSGPGAEAMRRTMATAGRTIVFSSLTVAAALASLLIFPQRFLYSMGLGGSLVALIAARPGAGGPPGHPRAARHAGQLARAGIPPGPSRARGTPHRVGLLVQAVALRDAAAGPDRDRERNAADRARDSVLRDQVHRRRRPVLPTSASARQVDTAMKTEFPPIGTRRSGWSSTAPTGPSSPS